jgi:hypothetical protein
MAVLCNLGASVLSRVPEFYPTGQLAILALIADDQAGPISCLRWRKGFVGWSRHPVKCCEWGSRVLTVERPRPVGFPISRRTSYPSPRITLRR